MIRGAVTPTPISKVDYPVKINLHNRFDIEVIDTISGEIKQTAKAFNCICNQLWTYLLKPSLYFNYIHYGDGSGTPSASDTQLFGYIGGESAIYVEQDGNAVEGWFCIKKRIQLSETTAAGRTLREVGIAQGSSANTLCTHAMLQDMNGNSISLEKTDTDIVNIYATVFVHFPSSGYFPQCSGYLSPGMLVNKWMYDGKYAEGFMTYLCGGTLGNMHTIAYAVPMECGVYDQHPDNDATVSLVYDVSNRTIKATMARLAAGHSNWQKGIKAIALFSGRYDVSSNKIYKPVLLIEAKPGCGWYTAKTILDEPVATGDGVTSDFATNFEPDGDVTVLVDGVAVPATIDRIKPGATINSYLRGLHRESTLDNLIPYPVPVPGTTFAGNSYYRGYYDWPMIVENTMCERFGINTVKVECYIAYCSDDLVNWTKVASYSQNRNNAVSIPEDKRKSRFWKFEYESEASQGGRYEFTHDAFPTTNIHLDTPPAAGSAIIAQYTPAGIAKDSNHVFDLTVTIQLGEYTE